MTALAFLILLWHYGLFTCAHPAMPAIQVNGVPQYVIDYGKQYRIAPGILLRFANLF
jgi:hypothetical protein